MMRSHLRTSEALAGRGFQGKCKLRVEIFIHVTQKEGKWGNSIHDDAVNLD